MYAFSMPVAYTVLQHITSYKHFCTFQKLVTDTLGLHLPLHKVIFVNWKINAFLHICCYLGLK